MILVVLVVVAAVVVVAAAVVVVVVVAAAAAMLFEPQSEFCNASCKCSLTYSTAAVSFTHRVLS